MATKVYLNLQIPEATILRESVALEDPNVPRTRNPLAYIGPTKKISYIQNRLDNKLEEDNMESYTCHATIAEIYYDHGWFYISCGDCKRKLTTKQSGARNWCDGCNKQPTHSESRLRLQFSIEDDSGTQDLTAFEDVAILIIGKTADDLFTLKRQHGNDAVLTLLDDLIGKTFHFQIKIDRYNVTHPDQPLTALAATPASSLQKKRRIRNMIKY